MMQNGQNSTVTRLTRRDFVKKSAVVTAGVSAGLMASGNFAYAGSNETLRVGLIGCGGRGTGAASQAYDDGWPIATIYVANTIAFRGVPNRVSWISDRTATITTTAVAETSSAACRRAVTRIASSSRRAIAWSEPSVGSNV